MTEPQQVLTRLRTFHERWNLIKNRRNNSDFGGISLFLPNLWDSEQYLRNSIIILNPLTSKIKKNHRLPHFFPRLHRIGHHDETTQRLFRKVQISHSREVKKLLRRNRSRRVRGLRLRATIERTSRCYIKHVNIWWALEYSNLLAAQGSWANWQSRFSRIGSVFAVPISERGGPMGDGIFIRSPRP